MNEAFYETIDKLGIAKAQFAKGLITEDEFKLAALLAAEEITAALEPWVQEHKKWFEQP
jgi:hypothetical protein